MLGLVLIFSTSTRFLLNWSWRWMLELVIIFPINLIINLIIKVDHIGELRWRTLEFEFSCGTTVQACAEETSDGPYFDYTIYIFRTLGLFWLSIRPAQIAELPRSGSDPELFSHSTFVSFWWHWRQCRIVYCDNFCYRKWIEGEERKRKWGNVESESHSLSISPLYFLIFSFSLRFRASRMPGCSKFWNPVEHTTVPV